MNKVILHIPHSSMVIPDYIRKNILLSDSVLKKELELLTDLYTDLIFQGKDTIKCTFSRFVCDVERFEDDALEKMSKLGMGAVYIKTPTGKKLRNADEIQRNHIMENYYKPHHSEFETMVEEKLICYNKCFILDCHSFNEEINYINMENAPDICIGSDSFHTPENIKNAAINIFELDGYKVSVNTPFSGSIVPLRYYTKDKRVSSIMIEINRKLYIKNENKINVEGMHKLISVCNQLIDLMNNS